jgi:REP element-mobilizing transposase RayT
MARLLDPNQPRNYCLPRLPREYYQGDAVVHWSLPIFDRATGWLTENFHARFRELMLHAAAREGLLCSAYVLMPDHIHLMWMGLRLDSDQINAMTFLRTYLEKALAPARFQPQPHDHVLRAEARRKNAFVITCRYILENPARARLVTEKETWQYLGCILPGYPTLHPTQRDYWPKFWKILAKTRQPNAGQIVRPPFNFGKPPIVGDDVRSL